MLCRLLTYYYTCGYKINMLKFVIILFFSFTISYSYSQVVINEIMGSNRTSISDEDGDFPDWIEIYNTGTSEIELAGFYLSDMDDFPQRWKFPEVTIKPGDFLLVFASGKDRSFTGKELHTNFSIKKRGEPVILSNSSGQIIDRLPPVYIETDYSFGRFPDGGDDLVLFKTATPGKSNIGPYAPPLFTKLSFSHKSGYYNYDFLLGINSIGPAEIRYTTDATNPIDSGMVYTNSIAIRSLAGTENQFAEIPTSIPELWSPPKGEVDKINIIRARPVINGIPVGEEIAGSFWTGHHNPENIKIPIVSIISCPENFFDHETGIYVPGIDYEESGGGNFYLRGRENERLSFFTFFDTIGLPQVHQQVGIRIHGNATRRYRQKSLRLYARSSYGNEQISYPFFEERNNHDYKRLLLASTMRDDMSKTLIKDELCTYVIRDLDIDYLAFIPVIVFLNGEYWGIHFLKERRDEHYLERNHGVSADNIDRLYNLGQVISGSNLYYYQMLNFLRTSDPEMPETYQKLETYIDVDNYIDYMCMQIFMQNRDWPHHNIEYWRPDIPGGKWRWIFWDLDRALEQYYVDNLSIYFEYEDSYQKYELLRLLVKIPEFKDKFIQRFYYHLNNTVSSEKVLEAIEHFHSTLYPYLGKHIQRWRVPLTLYEWEENIKSLEKFAALRPAQMFKILNDNFRSPFSISPNPAIHTLNIHFERELQKSDISIFNVKGQLIDISSGIRISEPNIEIDVNGLESGLYIIRITNNNMVYTNRFIKID